jgi:hypothetical protein
MSRPLVVLSDAGVLLGVRSGDHTLSATLTPSVTPDGGIHVNATDFGLGRLSLPAGLVLTHLRDDVVAEMPDDAAVRAALRSAIDALNSGEPLLSTAAIHLGDGRTVRILQIRPREGALDVWLRTE